MMHACFESAYDLYKLQGDKNKKIWKTPPSPRVKSLTQVKTFDATLKTLLTFTFL